MVGGSGTGKSVLMRSIIGLQRPDDGEVHVFGEPMLDRDEAELQPIRKRWGILFQGARLVLDPDRRRERPGAAARILPAPDREAARRDRRLQDRDESACPPTPAPKFPAELSGGMRKRAGIARALALDPELLFLDEPTAGLDPIGAAAFDQLIVELRERLGLTVFLITHDLDTLYAICDRVAVLADQQGDRGRNDSGITGFGSRMDTGIFQRSARPRGRGGHGRCRGADGRSERGD